MAAGFSLGRLHMGGICPPHMGETSAGGQSVNGGTHEGGHRPYGGDLTLIDYIISLHLVTRTLLLLTT